MENELLMFNLIVHIVSIDGLAELCTIVSADKESIGFVPLSLSLSLSLYIFISISLYIWDGGRNSYKLVNLRAVKCSTLYKNLSVYGTDILGEIQKVHLEIPRKISYPYIERYAVCLDVKI